MARTSGSGRRAMSAAALVRLPPDLAAAVKVAAAAVGLTDAAWLRTVAVAALSSDPVDVRPSRMRRGPPTLDVIAVAELRESVGEAVGALVRSAAFTRESGHADLHAELEDIIPRFRTAAFDLDALKATLL